MKVLFLAAGRRVSLAKYFIKHGFDIYSYETEINCPISTVATIILGKMWNDPDIKNHIIETINNINPDIILPLSDHATTILSDINNKGIITASKQANEICLNKKKFEEYLKDYYFYPNIDIDHKIILKPIYGANSKGIKIIDSMDYAINEKEYATNYIAQRLIEGFEISVDAYFNKLSQMVDAVPRKRIEIQGGEVSRSITLDRNAYNVYKLTKEIGEQIGLVGPVCAQYIIDKDNKAYIMEINARFGGGVILSLEAGFDQIQLLKDEWIYNKSCVPQQYNWKLNFGMVRYFQEYFYGGIDG